MKTRTNQQKHPPSAALAAMAEAKAAKAKESADDEVIVLSSDSEGEDDFAAGGALFFFAHLFGCVSSSVLDANMFCLASLLFVSFRFVCLTAMAKMSLLIVELSKLLWLNSLPLSGN